MKYKITLTSKLILNDDFSPSEKYVLAFLGLLTQDGMATCVKSNFWLAKHIGVTEGTMKQILDKLKNYAYKIDPNYPEGRPLITIKQNEYKEREIRLNKSMGMYENTPMHNLILHNILAPTIKYNGELL